jgi:hypothetical protein
MFVWFVSWPPFEYLIILTIIANCVVMSMDTHLPNGDKTILALQVSATTPDMIYDYINDPIVRYLSYRMCTYRAVFLL